MWCMQNKNFISFLTFFLFFPELFGDFISFLSLILSLIHFFLTFSPIYLESSFFLITFANDIQIGTGVGSVLVWN